MPFEHGHLARKHMEPGAWCRGLIRPRQHCRVCSTPASQSVDFGLILLEQWPNRFGHIYRCFASEDARALCKPSPRGHRLLLIVCHLHGCIVQCVPACLQIEICMAKLCMPRRKRSMGRLCSSDGGVHRLCPDKCTYQLLKCLTSQVSRHRLAYWLSIPQTCAIAHERQVTHVSSGMTVSVMIHGKQKPARINMRVYEGVLISIAPLACELRPPHTPATPRCRDKIATQTTMPRCLQSIHESRRHLAKTCICLTAGRTNPSGTPT
jgi:hypothetical protein